MKSRSALLPLAMLLMTACAGRSDPDPQPIPMPPSTGTDTGTTGIDPLCGQVRIVSLSRFDTDETKAQVIRNNAVIEEVCGAD